MHRNIFIKLALRAEMGEGSVNHIKHIRERMNVGIGHALGVAFSHLSPSES